MYDVHILSVMLYFIFFNNAVYLKCRFKPLETSKLIAPCREEFERLFHVTFSVKDNAQYLSNIQVTTAFHENSVVKNFCLAQNDIFTRIFLLVILYMTNIHV